MATTHSTSVGIENEQPAVRSVLFTAAYVGGIVATIALATGAAAVLAPYTAGLGQFVVLAAGWLVVVSASPEISERITKRLADAQFAQYVPRSSKTVHAVVSYFVAK